MKHFKLEVELLKTTKQLDKFVDEFYGDLIDSEFDEVEIDDLIDEFFVFINPYYGEVNKIN